MTVKSIIQRRPAMPSRVARLNRNDRPQSIGIGGHNASEYASNDRGRGVCSWIVFVHIRGSCDVFVRRAEVPCSCSVVRVRDDSRFTETRCFGGS